MPHQNLYPEFIFAIAIWLMAIFIFVIMLFAVFASFLAKYRNKIRARLKTHLNFSSVGARFTNFFPNKNTKIERDPDFS
jgi:hypothetical protein